jgi:hypothetical protein
MVTIINDFDYEELFGKWGDEIKFICTPGAYPNRQVYGGELL